MRKILAFLAAATLLFAASGCNRNRGSSSHAVSDASGRTESTMEPIAKEDVKVGVIHIGDPDDGEGYTSAHDRGILEMQKNIGLSDNQIVRQNDVEDTDADGVREAITACIEAGCNIIFGTSWGYMDVMSDMAEEYPDILFCHASGSQSNDRNFSNYSGRIYQACFLTGLAAGLKTESDAIGFVAAMGQDNAEVTGGIDAFALGVAAVNPDAKIYVKVINSWLDPTLEQQGAEVLLDMGCDVIAQHCGTTAPLLAAEARGKWGCGYSSDMTKAAPKAHLTAPVWNWGVYYTQAVQSAINGYKAENYFGGMEDGLVDISPLTDNCAEGTKEIVEAARALIENGSFKVFEGKLMTADVEAKTVSVAEGALVDNTGEEVCAAGAVLDDATITGAIHWYYKNVETV